LPYQLLSFYQAFDMTECSTARNCPTSSQTSTSVVK